MNSSNQYFMRIFTYIVAATLIVVAAILWRSPSTPPVVNTTKSTPNVTHAIERTLSIIKPNAVSKNVIGDITNRFEKAGLSIAAAKMVRLSKKQAEQFYAVHSNRPFFGALVDFMSSGPVLVLVLEGEEAISKNRRIMGATNPKDAAPGTIRADFADSITRNAVHGSDAPETAKQEISFFFKPEEIFARAHQHPRAIDISG